MGSVSVKVCLRGGVMPRKATPHDAAYDLFCPDDIVLRTGRQVIDTMIGIELPHGYAAIIQPRSGLSVRGMEVARYTTDGGVLRLIDSECKVDADVIVGLIDEKYRGNVGVIVRMSRYVYDSECFVVRKGTRIAQMRIVEVPDTELVEVEQLDMTGDRGGGYGHTGV